MRYIKPRMDILNCSRYVIYDRTTGSPTGREPYGDGDSIVVVGVTPHQGGWESQPQGEGNQESIACRELEVCDMQKAENILQALHRFGEKRIPVERIYRHLYNPDLYLMAYDKIGRHPGSMTPGVDGETADGTHLGTFHSIVKAMREERYQFKPVKRVYIPKKNGKKRPLGLPKFSDKLVQEVLRMMLEAYYEPSFRNCSHGFRPGRGCHTALVYIRRFFRGTVWFIEGDIKGCFDNIDHDVLLQILGRRIHDGRILELVRRYLRAGYVEDWTHHRTYSGTPQGGVLSPLLANIYLHELDVFIMDELRPRYQRGDRGHPNPEYTKLSGRIQHLKRKGNMAEAKALTQERRRLPTRDPRDKEFRRLRYCRYADDFVLGFIGPKSEAEQIKREIGVFLREKLHLDMSPEKTLITHGKTGHAVFLNYDLSVYQSNDYITKNAKGIKRRSANGQVRLGLPYRLVDEKCKPYLSRGKPIPQIGSMAYSDGHIIATYQTIYRGIAEYYKYAVDRYRLVKLKHIMECSLTKTLASKYRVSVSEIYRRYRSKHTVNGYTYKTLEATVQKGDQEVILRWGAIPLRVDKTHQASIDDRKVVVYQPRSDLIQRLLRQECELCGAREHLEVHHVRKLADLKARWRGRREKPRWVSTMIAMRRKTLVVCHECHTEIHRCGA